MPGARCTSFYEIEHSDPSFEARVFINAPKRGASTPREDRTTLCLDDERLSLRAAVATLLRVGARRDYDGWVEGDVLDPEAAAVLAYLDRLADAGPEPSQALAAHIDDYGIVTSTISLDGGAQVFLQAGDGWDRVLWTCPSGRVYEWIWRERETPRDLDALLAGRGVERTAWLRQRLAGARLVLEDCTLVTKGRLRLALLHRFGIRLRERDEPAR